MSEINPICRDHGIKETKSLSASEQTQISSLDDFAKALKMYNLVKGSTSQALELLKGLSDEAKEIFSKAKVEEASNDLDFIVKKFVGTVKLIDRLPTGEKARLLSDRVSLIKIIESLQTAFDVALDIAMTLSEPQVMAYQDHMSKAQGASATQRILNGLGEFVENIKQNLSSADKAALGSIDSKKISDHSVAEIEALEGKAVSLIKEICAPPIVAPPPIIEVVLPPHIEVVVPPKVIPAPPAPVFDAAARLGGGYGGRALGMGGASGSYRSGKTNYQLDYAADGEYEVSSEDSAKASFRYDGDSLKMLAKGGGNFVRTQEKSLATAAVQDIFLSYRLGIISLNLAETLETQIGGGDFKTNADPSVSLIFGKFALTAGGAFDYEDGAVLGGLGGVSYRSKKHDASVLARNTYGKLSAGARYFYNDLIGAAAQYDIIRAAQTASATARAKIHLGKGFYFEPFAGGELIDGKPGASGGAFLRYGELMPQNPNPLTPHSIDPLTEDR